MGKMLLDTQDLIDKVCSNCPASNFGETTNCSFQNMHVGKVKECRQWDAYLVHAQGLHSTNDQLGFLALEPAMELLQRAEQEIRDYKFLTNEIDRLEKKLNEVQSNITAMYGTEASLPKPQNVNSDKTARDADKRLKISLALDRVRNTVYRIEAAKDTLTDLKEIAILECLMDMVPMKYIASHVGVSRQKFYEIYHVLIRKMVWEMYGKEGDS